MDLRGISFSTALASAAHASSAALAHSAALAQSAASTASKVAAQHDTFGASVPPEDPFLGQTVHMKGFPYGLRVVRLLGEWGFAFVYQVRVYTLLKWR
jgi:hypothetical protein